MLHLILGRAGSGKTHYIRELINDISQTAQQKIMLIVPEQYSFESECALLKRLGAVRAQRVEVMSFKRLCDRIFREYGGKRGTELDKGGRHVLMSLALKSVQDRLVLYKGGGVELAASMLKTIDEFKVNRITPDQIRQACSLLDMSTLKQKAQEIALIYEAYDSVVKQNYIDPKDDLTRLDETLKTVHFFNDYIVCFDAFYSFLQQELNIISHIIRQSREVYCTLCTPGLNDTDKGLGLFSTVQLTARRLIDIAKKSGVPIVAPVILNEPVRFKSDSLKALEQGIYRYDAKPCANHDDSVALVYIKNIYDECEYIASAIKALVREHNYRYRDIVVIARSLEDYGDVLQDVFEKYEIPYYMDKRQGIADKSLMIMVCAAFDCVLGNFNADDVFRYLKTNLCGLSTGEISEIENYALIWRITGSGFLKEWKCHPEGFSEGMSQQDKERLKYINELRERAISPLVEFKKKISNTDGIGISRAVFELLQSNGADKNLYSLSQQLMQQGESSLSSEGERLWDTLMHILDQMALIIGERHIDAKEYARLLEGYIKECDLGVIPQGLDQVSIGSADRIRPDNPKVAFIVGANEGVFPSLLTNEGMFHEGERQKLLQLGLNLLKTFEKRAIEERLITYTALTCASDRLYITCPACDKSGQALAPSVIVSQVKKLLPEVQEIKGEDLPPLFFAAASRPAFEMMARLLREQEGDSAVLAATLRQYFKGQDRYKELMGSLEVLSDNSQAWFLNSNVSLRLFGRDIVISPSKMEKFYMCRFSYFCKYGLGAKVRREVELDPLEFGSAVHYVLECIVKKYGTKLPHIDTAALFYEVDRLLSDYVERHMGGFEDKPARFVFLYRRLVKTAQNLILHLRKELKSSSFVPVDFELKIGRSGDIEPLQVELEDGGRVFVEGKVDRVDIMEREDKSYIRIIDYKTGAKQFRLSEVLFGLNMQMLIYLFTIWKNGKERYGQVVPAGILYMPVADSTEKVDRGLQREEIEKIHAKSLRMNGLVLDDAEIVRAMDSKGIFISQKILKSGEVGPADAVVSLAQMGKIGLYLEKLVADMAHYIRKGDIAALPVVGGFYDACKWCDYREVCGFERGGETRFVYKMNKSEVFDLIDKSIKGGEANA